MTWSAPTERTRSIFAVLHTPVTSAPNDLAICTANSPTPPEAPMIRTCCPGCDPAGVAKRLEGGAGGGGYGCRLLEGEVRRLERERVFSGGCVLGKGAVAGAEDLVAGLEPRHVLADRLDGAGDIHAPNTSLGCAEPEAHDAHQVRLPGHHVPVADVDAGRPDADEHVVVADRRACSICCELEHVRLSRTCPARSPASVSSAPDRPA